MMALDWMPSPVLETDLEIGYRYYYTLLSKEQREEYLRIRSYIANHEPCVTCAAIDDLPGVFRAISADHPELIEVESTYSMWDTHLELTFEYVKEQEVMPTARLHAKALVQTLVPPNATAYEKVRLIYEYLCKNIKYGKSDPQTAHNMIGPLLYQTGVCDGISNTMKHLLDLVGVPALVVHGKGYELNTAMGVAKKVNGGRHAWCMVRLEGKWYHIDTTYDLTNEHCDEPLYSHFLLNSNAISRNHDLPANIPSSTDGTRTYFAENGTCFSTHEELRAWLGKRRLRGRKRLLFQLAETPNEELAYKEVLDIITDTYLRSTVYYNNSQRVFLVDKQL